MAYKEFSYFYDFFNSKADYDKLFEYIDHIARENNCKGKILCDLGRGTGELALRFNSAGYDVVAVDSSDEMLNVLYDKKYDYGADNLLILKQDITQLDMFGTVDVFTCTFDTVNHLDGSEAVKELFNKVRLFMHPDGVFVFDVNSPYKHEKILVDNEFILSDSSAVCKWKNQLLASDKKTKISIEIDDIEFGKHYSESFYEYYYTIEEIDEMLLSAGLKSVCVVDGESFKDIIRTTQRYLFTVKKENYG